MPRWRALPEELDPQVREFAEQLRRLVERSGLSIAAVADRTGYSKTSWERYLNGRLLPPRGAAEALAEATGADPGHLGTMWELAERSWSRSELRHDVTMEAIKVAEARAALGAFGPPPEEAGRGRRSGGGRRIRSALRSEGALRTAGAATAAATADPPVGADGPEESPQPQADAGRSGRRGRLLSRPGGSPDVRARAIPVGKGGRNGGRSPRRTAVLFALGGVGTALVIVSAVLLLGSGDDGGKKAEGPLTSPSVSSSPAPAPAGVKCTGAECAGKDPETMGCGGRHATTAGSTTVGTSYVEVRYSKVCSAAWARLTQAVPGDSLRISNDAATPARTERGRVDRGTDAHTNMVPADGPRQATACVTLVSGRKGCTVPSAP
ncbi:helix-turn-helix domain-containing protein [Streptomyces sp. NPDC002536]